jgi:tRNA A-37 threonylcarbamoyl transferase component Bud32
MVDWPHTPDPQRLRQMLSIGEEIGPGDPFEPAPGEEIDGFEIIELVGQGGMGRVYRARELELRRTVALKIVRPDGPDPKAAVRRFRREAILAANLSHPNIVPVFRVGTDRPCYFAMEFVRGRSLRQVVEQDGPFALAEAVRVAICVADALQHAHRHHVLHRDVKPDNILLEEPGGRVLVSDFGIARDTTGRLAETTQPAGGSPGTLSFMSPEQALGDDLDARTDVYSLGVTLYYMVTGRVAWPVRNRAELAWRTRKERPTPPGRWADLPRDLERVVLRMIEPDRERRYRDCGEVLVALRALQPRPKPAPVRRRRLVAVLALAALAGIGAWLWGRSRAARERPGEGPRQPALTWSVEHTIQHDAISGQARSVLGDWNGDGVLELFLTTPSGFDVIALPQGTIAGSIPAADAADGWNVTGAWDFDGDGADEAVVSSIVGTRLELRAVNYSQRAVARFVAEGSQRPVPGGGMSRSTLATLGALDLEGDGRRELLASVCTGYGKQPRKLCCFDVATGQLGWELDVPGASLTADVAVADLTGDGRREVIYGTWAPANGRRLPDGRHDGAAYVYAVSHQGKPLWVRQVGVHPHLARVDVLPADTGEPCVFAWCYASPRFGRTVHPVRLFEADGSEPARYDPRGYLLDCSITDLDDDGRPEVLVFDGRGILSVLDRCLRPVRETQLVAPSPLGLFYLAEEADLTGDGAAELVLVVAERADPPALTRRTRLLVLDRSLCRIGEFQIAGPLSEWIRPTCRALPGSRRLLVLADRGLVLAAHPRRADD